MYETRAAVYDDCGNGKEDAMPHQTSGKCRLCGKVFGGNVMARHLEACLEKSPALPAAKKRRVSQKLLHIAAKGADDPDYWMHLLVPSALRLDDLDDFLRDVWLECCAHMSAFTIDSQRYSVSPDEWEEEKSMSVPLWKALEAGVEFVHEYDFGSTTTLKLKVVGEHVMESAEGAISILARNAPPEHKCAKCGARATSICVECMYDGPEAFLCGTCSKEHECGEELLLPVVNSPRMGVCGYSGEEQKDEDAYG
jgi:hypothetical protein